jgi:hypothetical protein
VTIIDFFLSIQSTSLFQFGLFDDKKSNKKAHPWLTFFVKDFDNKVK